MKCIDCGDTGQIPLYTSVSVCTSCDIATVNRYVIDDLREAHEGSHHIKFEPFVVAIQQKTSRAFRLLINDALYRIETSNPDRVDIIPRDKTVRAWAYHVGNENVVVIFREPTIIDGDDYAILEIVHKDRYEDLM